MPNADRPFRMGFSAFPYDLTQAAIDQTYATLHREGDIYVQQFDAATLPWGAALTGGPFPASFQEELDRAVENRIIGVPLVLAIMPLTEGRDGIAPAASGTLPAALDGKAFDDPAYVAAFTNYAARLIDQLHPAYLVTGLEVNELYLNNKAIWPAYTRFATAVRSNLRARFPDLPASESISLHSYFDEGKGNDRYREATISLLETQDYTSVSYYPFLYGAYQDPAAFNTAFDFLKGLTTKPIAFTETGNIAERLVLPSFGVDLPGSLGGQETYIRTLLSRAGAEDYLFVINWASQDFDAVTAALPKAVQEFASVWQDTGLFDQSGTVRPALLTWRTVFNRPLH